MIDKNDETAFPVPIGQTGEDRCGMSMRDWFAGQVIPELLGLDETWTTVSRMAYTIADAMLEARKEVNQ